MRRTRRQAHAALTGARETMSELGDKLRQTRDPEERTALERKIRELDDVAAEARDDIPFGRDRMPEMD